LDTPNNETIDEAERLRRRSLASAMGSIKSEKKTAAARARAAAKKGVPLSEEMKAKMAEGQRRRWAAYREANPKPAKKKPGRPRKPAEGQGEARPPRRAEESAGE
jgi:hypothetical protein